MELRELVRALRTRDALKALAEVLEALRSGADLTTLELPDGDGLDRALAASVVELLAERWNRPAPAWAAAIPPSPTPFFLVASAESMPSRRRTASAACWRASSASRVLPDPSGP